MSYSDWQADTIRRALNRYRYNAGRNGTALSLTRVHELILLSDRSPRSDALKYEVLRRFATSDHLPEAHNLNSIRDFLLAEKYLSEEELDPKTADLEEMLAVQAYLANYDERAKAAISEVHPNYRAELENQFCMDRVTLRTLIDKSGCFFKVEEIFERTLSRVHDKTTLDEKEGLVNMRVRRKGYGFVSTPHNLVYIFVRGAIPMDRTTYVQIWATALTAVPGNLVAMRSGDGMLWNSRDEEYKITDGPVEVTNIYRFSPHTVEHPARLLT